MMLELYAAAEGLRQQRLAREEAERKRQEDARREEERQNIPDIGGKRRIIQRSTALLRWLILLMTMTPLARFAATYQRIK